MDSAYEWWHNSSCIFYLSSVIVVCALRLYKNNQGHHIDSSTQMSYSDTVTEAWSVASAGSTNKGSDIDAKSRSFVLKPQSGKNRKVLKSSPSGMAWLESEEWSCNELPPRNQLSAQQLLYIVLNQPFSSAFTHAWDGPPNSCWCHNYKNQW